MTAIPENEDACEHAARSSPLTPEERQAMKARLKARTIAWRHMPVFRLSDVGKRADIQLPKESRLPLSVLAVRQFILNLTLDNNTGLPNWCRITKKNNASFYLILAIDDVSLADLQENPHLLPETNKLFKDGVEMTSAWSEGVALSQSLAFVPVPGKTRLRAKQALGSFRRAIKEKYIQGVVELADHDRKVAQSDAAGLDGNSHAEGSIKTEDSCTNTEEETSKPETNVASPGVVAAVKEEPSVTEDANGNVTIQTPPPQRTRIRRCSKLQLLLSPAQLVAEAYPLPGYGKPGFRFTKDAYLPVSEESRMYSIDCEWGTCIDGSKGLSRVAIVDDKLETIYHTFVKPRLPVIDYVTRVTGITKETLRYVKTTLEDVQEYIRELLPADAILVGQSLNSDLDTLKLYHPYIIDTSVIYNLTGRRSGKSKLQLLADNFLGKTIQCSASGHHPEEDALASMELVLLKLKMGVDYGDAVITGHTNWRIFPEHRIRDILLAEENEDIAEAEEETDDESEAEEEETEKEETEKELTYTDAIARGMKRKADDMKKPKVRKLYENMKFYMKYCLMLHIHNVTATLITTDATTAEIYRPAVTKPNERLVKKKLSEIEKPVVAPVNIEVANALDDAVAQVGESLKSTTSKITLVHTSINAIDCKDRNEQLKALDQFISKVYSLVPLKGVLTVILSGKKNPTENGACLVKINKPYIT